MSARRRAACGHTSSGELTICRTAACWRCADAPGCSRPRCRRPGLTGRARALHACAGGDPHRAGPEKGLPAGQRQPGAAGDRGRRQQAHKAGRCGHEEVPRPRCCCDRARAPPPLPACAVSARRACRLIVYCFEAAIELLDKEKNPNGKTVGIFDLRGDRPPGSGASMQAHVHPAPCNDAYPRRYPAGEPGRRGAARRVCSAAGLRGPRPGSLCALRGSLGALRAAPCRRTASHLQAPQRVQWCVRQPAPSRACNPDVEVTRRPQQPLLGS